MTFFIAPVVEGESEVKCVPALIERIWSELLSYSDSLQVLEPSRGPRDRLIDATRADLSAKINEAYVRLTHRMGRNRSDSRGFVLLLLDAEDDCPADLAPRLMGAAKLARKDADIACVLANKMLENWIVAGASTLAGVNGMPSAIPPRNQFEERRGSFWLEQQLRLAKRSRGYKKIGDIAAFFRAIDLNECRRNSPSFDKLCRELEARLPSNPHATHPDGPTP